MDFKDFVKDLGLREEHARFQQETKGELIPIFLGFKSSVIMVFYVGPLSKLGIVPIGSIELDEEAHVIRAIPVLDMVRHFPDFCKEFKMGEIVDAFIWIRQEFVDQITEYKDKIMDEAVKTYSCGNPAHDALWRTIFETAEDVVPGSAIHMMRKRKEEVRAKNVANIMDKAQKMYQSHEKEKSQRTDDETPKRERKGPCVPYLALFERKEGEPEVQEDPRCKIVNLDQRELPEEYPTDKQKQIAQLLQTLRIYNVNLKDEADLGREYIKPYRYNGPVFTHAQNELQEKLTPISFVFALESPDDGEHDVPPANEAVLIAEIHDEYFRVLRQFWAYPKELLENEV
jgi:hypothetical protein